MEVEMPKRTGSPADELLAAIQNETESLPGDTLLPAEHVEKLASAIEEIAASGAFGSQHEAGELTKVASEHVRSASVEVLRDAIRASGGYATPGDALKAILDGGATKSASIEEELISAAAKAAVSAKTAEASVASAVDRVLSDDAAGTGLDSESDRLVALAAQKVVEAGNAR